VKVTEIVQFVVGCSATATQSSVSLKAPLAVMLVKVMGAVPTFVATTAIGADVVPTATLPKFRLEAESVSVDVVPVKLIVCGLPGALSVNVIVALRTPFADGVNVAVIVQVAPGAIGAAHVVVIAKSPGFTPPSRMLKLVSVESPFVSVMTSGALVVSRLWAGKTNPEGFNAIPFRMLTFETKASHAPA
jgi:hypothetical protein